MTKKIAYVLILIALAAIVSLGGCPAPSQKTNDTLSGKDVFNPSLFSMATYTMTVGNQSAGQFQVLSHTGEDEGDRLTTIAVTAESSRRMDAWLNRSREGVNKAIMTVIDQGGIQSMEVPKAYDMTTMDGTWNSPDAEYAYYGSDTVTVPAGKYENCSVYYGTKHIQFQNDSLDLTVLYYIHPSSPVPVLYMVKSGDDLVAYALESVYGPDDFDSTPERAAQSYFDRIGSGEYKKAARLLVTSRLQPLDRATIVGMEENMTRTYGTSGEKMAIQYVVTGIPGSTGAIDGHETVLLEWSSLHYSPGEVYSIDGSFNMVYDDGWKIIV